jgi:hypothetical protein
MDEYIAYTILFVFMLPAALLAGIFAGKLIAPYVLRVVHLWRTNRYK